MNRDNDYRDALLLVLAVCLFGAGAWAVAMAIAYVMGWL